MNYGTELSFKMMTMTVMMMLICGDKDDEDDEVMMGLITVSNG